MPALKEKRFRTTEDFAALLIGGLILLSGLLMLFVSQAGHTTKQQVQINEQMGAETAPFHTVQWYDNLDQLKKLDGEKTKVGSFLKKWTGKPGGWKTNPLKSMSKSEAVAVQERAAVQDTFDKYTAELAALKAAAAAAGEQARQSAYGNDGLNTSATQAIERWREKADSDSSLRKKAGTKPFNKWGYLLLLGLLFVALFGGAQQLRGFQFSRFAVGFIFVFGLAVVCQLLGQQASAKEIGFGYAAWAILLGLLISNTIGTPGWVKAALTSELFIKTGLIILGAEILFGKVLAIGLPGIFVAWVVTPIVLLSTYWFGQKVLKIKSKTLNMTISADMSVCGVSAAVATAAACNAKKEELTMAIGLSMIFTSVMMIVLPIVINSLGLPEVLGGAWIGGTIDATGAVVAAGAFLGDTALNVAATIKMIQNILIGIIAFGVAVYFSRMEGKAEGSDIGWGEVWRRFPKFILGFIGASILFSIIYASSGDDLAYALIDKGVISAWSKNLRGWLFCLAFVSIGLSTNFKELRSHFQGGKPLVLYLCGQAFNLCLTLLMAYIMFYLVFPEITESI